MNETRNTQFVLTSRPAGPETVTVTGDFDNWGQLCPLVKQQDGSFEASVPLPDGKVNFKFVVDGNWTTSENYPQESDEGGNVNNVLTTADVAAKSAGAAIPESGGIPTTTKASSKSVDTEVIAEPVQPTDPETENVTQEQATAAIAKGPGIVIPEDAQTNPVFTEIRDVDPKTLNEPESTEAAAITATTETVPATETVPTTETTAKSVPATETATETATGSSVPTGAVAAAAKTEGEGDKYVKKVVRKVKKEPSAAKSTAKSGSTKIADTAKSTATKATTAAKSTATTATETGKKKKKGFLSKLKKIFD